MGVSLERCMAPEGCVARPLGGDGARARLPDGAAWFSGDGGVEPIRAIPGGWREALVQRWTLYSGSGAICYTYREEVKEEGGLLSLPGRRAGG